MAVKKGPLYSQVLIDKKRKQGKRFSPARIREIKAQYEGIYLHEDEKRFIALANVGLYDPRSNKRIYRQKIKTCKSVVAAQKWISETLAQSEQEFPLNQVASTNQTLNLGQASTRLLKEKEDDGQHSANDTRRYHQRLLDFFGEHTPLNEIKKPQIVAYRQHLQDQKKQSRGKGRLSDATINHHLASLRHLFNWAHEEELIEHLPKVKLLKVESTKKELEIDVSDYLRFVDCLPSIPRHHKVLALLSLNTATRWGDASKFRWNQFIFKPVKEGGRITKQLHIRYRSSKTRSGYISIPILDVTKDILERYLQHPKTRKDEGFQDLESLMAAQKPKQKQAFLCLNPKTKKPYTSMKRAMETAVRKAGIPRITFHDIRRLMTTIIIEETGDYELAQQVGRWSNQAMRTHYTSLGRRPRTAFAKINATIEAERKRLDGQENQNT